MSMYSPSIEKLIQSFEKLPSIGNKTAARLAFYMLNASEEETNEFVSSIINAKKNLKFRSPQKAPNILKSVLACVR